MKKRIIDLIKTFASDLRTTIVGLVLGGLLFGGVVYVYLQNLWIAIKEAMLSPTPLWATIALVLALGVYIYIKISKLHSSEPPNRKPKIKYIPIGEQIWKTIIKPTGKLEIERAPFCKKHDCQFIRTDKKWYCPEVDKGTCNNIFDEEGLSELKKKAESFIEQKIRHNDY